MLATLKRSNVIDGDIIDADTEFLIVGNTIRLLSVGMIRESDGAKLYMLSHDWRDVIKQAKDVDPWVYENVCAEQVLFVVPPIEPKSEEEVRERILEFVGDNPRLWFYVQSTDKVVLDNALGSLSKTPKTWPKTALDIAVIVSMSGIDKGKEYQREYLGNEKPEHCAVTDSIYQRRLRRGILSRAADGEFGTISQSILDYANHIPK